MFREIVLGIASAVMATHADGQASSSLAPLSQSEEQDLVDAYIMYRVCRPYVSLTSQIYARELQFKAGKANPSTIDYFKAIEDGLHQHPELFMVTRKKCDRELPDAFKGLELFKRIIGK